MTSIILTAPLIDRDLTAPERLNGTAVNIVFNDDTYITRAGNTYITRGGNTMVAHNNYTGYPIALTAVLVDKELTAQERQ